jgi:predicted KAP-like P-loop ATPase
MYESSPFFYDSPIASTTQDLFGRKKFAEQLAIKIKSRKPIRGAIAIGINGAWGSRKTSFLNMVLNYLDRPDRIIIKFEPWKSKSTKEIIKGFFDLMIEKLEAENKQLSFSRQEYAEKLVELDENIYTKVIRSVSSFFDNTPDIKEKLYDEINIEIANIKKQIIIVIDDLDRLDKKEIIEVIRLIRNTADFNGVTFLACYDKGYIVNAIKDLNEYNHSHYLEKIFQYEFVLPVFDFDILKQQLVEFAKSGLNETQIEEFGGILYRTDIVIDIKPLFLKTQRDVIRLANGFFFEFKSLDGEVDMEDLFCLHLLKLKYQNVYELLIEQKEFFFLQQNNQAGDNTIRLRKTSEIGIPYTGGFSPTPIKDGENTYAFQTYLKENKESLQLSEGDLDTIENFMKTIFDMGSNYRKRFFSTNEIIYAQSFDKYFAYDLLKNNISTKEFITAKSGLDSYLTYLKLRVDLTVRSHNG